MPSTVVSTSELAAHAEWRVFDCRHDLAKPALGEEQYREAHIRGALFAHLDRDLSAPKTGGNGRHPLPRPGVFTAWVGTQGIKPSNQVVCYDAGNGAVAAPTGPLGEGPFMATMTPLGKPSDGSGRLLPGW